MLATIALAASLGAHWVDWSAPGLTVTQKAVAVGTPRKDERLILFFRTGRCEDGMAVKSGRYGDLDASLDFLLRAKPCMKE